MRVLFMHGLESSPQGDKARYLARHFEARTPAMDTSPVQAHLARTRDADDAASPSYGGALAVVHACLDLQAREVAAFRPDVVVGSSFGGALAVILLARGVWSGPTLLLAQASARFDPTLALPEGVPALLVHGTRDDVVDIEGSRRLARTGTPGLVKLVEVDDGHRLQRLLATDRLADLVREVAALRPA